MQVRFLKDHVDWKTGDVASIDDSMAAYMLLCSVVEPADINHEKAEEILLNHLEEIKESSLNTSENITTKEIIPPEEPFDFTNKIDDIKPPEPPVIVTDPPKNTGVNKIVTPIVKKAKSKK